MTLSRFLPHLAALAFAAVFVAGCVNETALDDLPDTKPQGSAFNKALFRDYASLAHSFGSVGVSAGRAFDVNGSVELAKIDSRVGALANAYAAKALTAARGAVVEPEPGVDITTHKMRDRLIRAIERGRDNFPEDSARAQADYDCWRMNAPVRQMRRASDRCAAALDVSLPRLEAEAKPPAPPPAPAEPAAPDNSTNSDKPAVQP